MRAFQDYYQMAIARKGSAAIIEANLPKPKTVKQLTQLSDDRYFSELSRRVFRAGLKHSMVDQKWPAFEEAFAGFDPFVVANFSDEKLEQLAAEPKIIRHYGKIQAVRGNALMLLDIRREFGSVGKFIAEWPIDNIIDLWAYLKKYGKQLGGHSGARFLRMVGKDTFLLTDDVVKLFVQEGVLTKTPTSKRDLRVVQTIFNEWHAETKRPLSALSRILSFTSGDNYSL